MQQIKYVRLGLRRSNLIIIKKPYFKNDIETHPLNPIFIIRVKYHAIVQSIICLIVYILINN